MNSNWKLLPATLLVAVLALAGCGGGSGGDTTPDPAPMPTPEEQCQDAGNLWEDGECKTAEDLREEGREAEAAEREAAAAAEARQAAAEKFHGLLSATGDTAVVEPENGRPDGTPVADYTTEIGAAEDGAYNRNMIQLMIRDTMGSPTASEFYTGELRDPTNTVLTTAANARHVMASGFATGQNELKEHDSGDELDGSYMGAAGTYTCAAT